MNIIPSNNYKVGFKQSQTTAAEQTAVDNSAKNKQIETLSSNPIGAAQVNFNTPISYKKISEFKVPGSDSTATLYKLTNGQRVVILPQKGPAVVKTYFNVGSMNEPDHLRGISHYIEHNLFNGTDKLGPGEFFHKVSDLGAYTNAGTSYNQTSYHIKSQLLNENYLEEIIKLHSDQVQNPKFAQDQLIKEKGPVTSEISMYADNCFNIGRNIALKNLFQINSTSDDVIAGSISNINSITREDVVNYYNTWYTPDNTTTVITGDVSPDQAMELVSKNFNKKQPQQTGKRKYEELIQTDKPVRVDIKKANSPATIINMGFVGPENNNTKDKISLEALAMILSGLNNSRLNKALEKYQLGAEFSIEKIGNKPNDKQGVFIALASSEEKSELALKVIYDEIQKLKTNPPSAQELNTAKEKLKLNLSENNESSIGINEFIGNALLDNDANYLANYKAIVDNLTVNDLVNAADKYLDLGKTSISVVHPEKTSNEQIQANYKKTHVKNQSNIAFKGSFTPANIDDLFSNVKEYKLNNNIEVAINPTNSDFATYQLDFRLPAFLDISAPELMILTEMLNRGSKNINKETFNDILDSSNINLGFAVSPERLSISGKLPKEKLSQGLTLTNEILNNPRFTKEDFEWAKQQVKDLYENQPKSASNKLDNALYPHLKYMNTSEEAIKNLETITLQNIEAAYKAVIDNAQGTAVLSAPTDKNPELATEFMNNLSQNIKTLNPVAKTPINTFIKNDQPQIFTETEQRLQAEVVQAFKFKNTGNIEDKAKTMVLNTILGANSSSRLFNDLRESQKLAYYVASKIEEHGDTSIIKLNILTTTDDPKDPTSSPENVKKSLSGFEKHINSLKTTPVTNEELQKAKLVLKNNILNSVETSMGKTLTLAEGMDSYYGLNSTKKLLETIDKVTIQDVQNAANHVFKDAPITSILASENTIKTIS